MIKQNQQRWKKLEQGVPLALIITSVLALMAIWTVAPPFGQPPPGELYGADGQTILTFYAWIFDVPMWGTVIFGVAAMFWGAIQHRRKRDWRVPIFFGCFYLELGGVLAFVRMAVDGVNLTPLNIYGGW